MKLRKQRAGPLASVESIGAPTTPKYWRAGLAQLVEHLICNQGVAGSNPAAGTISTTLLRNQQRVRRIVAIVGFAALLRHASFRNVSFSA